MDGSVIWSLDIFSAVNECLKTHSQADTVVDVLMTSRKTLKQVDASNYHSIHMLWRYLEISRYYGQMDGLLRAQFAYPDLDFRYIVSPSSELPSSLYPLNFTQAQVDSMVQMGVQDGVNAVSNGPQDAKDTLHFFALKKKRDPRVSGLSYEDFVEKKLAGEFEDYSQMFKDSKLQSLFLQ